LPAGAQLDYSITSPIPSNGVLCKSNTPYPTPSATWTAGQSVTVTFQGSAIHGGGHCQWSISYDNGKTFVVLYEVLTTCFIGNTGGSANGYPYTIKLPADLPSSDKAVFAWSWVNAVGNREFYMNCADVKITGSSATSFSGKEITIANHDGYPSIAAFGGTSSNSDSGLQYYNNAKTITITASGGSSSSGGSSAADSVSGSESDANTPVAHAASVSDMSDLYVSSAQSQKVIYDVFPSGSDSGEMTTLIDNDNSNSGGESDGSSEPGVYDINPSSSPSSGDDATDSGIGGSDISTESNGSDTGSDAATASGDGSGGSSSAGAGDGSGGSSAAGAGDTTGGSSASSGSGGGGGGGSCSTNGQM
ncbi:hypothetical protein GGI23_007630, partial [Coemansia sp. RSA 2559]